MNKSKYGEVELSGSTIVIGLFIFVLVGLLTIISFFYDNSKDYKSKIEITYQDNSKEVLNYDKSVTVELKEGDLKINNCVERSSVKAFNEITIKK